MHQHVSLQATLVWGNIAALGTAMDLFTGMQMSNVLLKLHRVKCDKRAKVTAKLVVPRVTMALMLEEDRLIGAREITLRAVVGKVCAMMSLHVLLTLEDGPTSVMTTLYCLDPMHLCGVSEQGLAKRTLERAAIFETGHWPAVR